MKLKFANGDIGKAQRDPCHAGLLPFIYLYLYLFPSYPHDFSNIPQSLITSGSVNTFGDIFGN
jgi:hypothetical protein